MKKDESGALVELKPKLVVNLELVKGGLDIMKKDESGALVELKPKLVVNLELVKGCRNKGCSCWNTSCKQDGTLNFMSKSTLNKWIHILRNEATLDILALYGLGESLEHPEFSEFCAIANKELKMPVQLNSDSHAIIKFASRISSLTSNIGKLVVTYKDMKGLLTRKIISNIHSQKLVHCFIIPELTQDYVMQIDNYISDVIYAHPDEKFAIVPKWDCEFGNMPTLKRFDTNDVKILGEPYQKEFVMKAYICWDGTLRKCFFDHRKFKSIDDIINTTSCEDCTALQQIYRIWVNTPEERKIGLKAGTIDGIYYSECGAACAY